MLKNILTLLKNILFKKSSYNGVILDEINPGLAHYDLVFDIIAGGKTKDESFDWRTYAGNFLNQKSAPTCVAQTCRNVKAAMQKKQIGEHVYISPINNFFEAGGTQNGSSVVSNLNIELNRGGVLEADKPYPDPNSYTWEELKAYALNVDISALALAKHTKIDGYSYVNPRDKSAMIDALEHSPLHLIVRMSKDWYKDRVYGHGYTDSLHDITLLYIDHYGNYHIQDSLGYYEGFSGHKIVDNGFPQSYILSAFSVRDLPDDWKAIQEAKKAELAQHCLNHYGQRRDFAKEQIVAAKMVTEFKKFNNQSVWEAAGRFWTILVNMGAYGGYSISYHKNGKWCPGDIINFVYHWRRTGKLVFDPNKLRNEYK